MKERNCPNCSAPYDIELMRCPYCGTAYFDISIIDIDSHEPFFLKLKTNGVIITQLVMPVTVDMEYSVDSYYATDNKGNRISTVTGSIDMKTDLEFRAIPFKSNLACDKEVYYLAEEDITENDC